MAQQPDPTDAILAEVCQSMGITLTRLDLCVLFRQSERQ